MAISNTHDTSAEPRRRRDPEVRPQQILDAAIEIFGENGFAAARTDDIAAKAGVAKGTVFLYFPTKDDLFKAVVRREIVARIEDAERMSAEAPAMSAREFLRAFLTKYYASTKTKQALRMLRMVMGELHKHPELARFYGTEVIERAWRVLAAAVQRGVESGEFRSVDPMLAARCITSAFLMHRNWMEPASPGHHLVSHLHADQLGLDLVDFFIDALAATPAAGTHTP